MAVTGSAYAITLGIYTAVAVGILVFFGIARTSTYTKYFYAPKCYSRATKHKPPILPWSFIGWVIPVVTTTSQDVLAYGSVDALLLVRVVVMGQNIFAFLIFICCVIILPVNLSGGNVDFLLSKPNNNFDLSSLDKMTMTNIKSRSNLLYAHVFVTYCITLVVLQVLWHMSKVAVALRIRYLEEQEEGDEAYTVLVQDVPGVFVGTPLHRFGTKLLFFVPKKSREDVALRLDNALDRCGEWTSKQKHRLDKLTSLTLEWVLGAVAWLDGNINKGARQVHRQMSATGEKVTGKSTTVLPAGAKDTKSDGHDSLKYDDKIGSHDKVEKNISGYNFIGLGRHRSASGSDTAEVEAQNLPEAGSKSTVLNVTAPTDGGMQSVYGIGVHTELHAWPPAERSLKQGKTVSEMTEQHFTKLYPGEISEVHVVHDTSDLDPLVAEYNRLQIALGDMFDFNVGRVRRNKPIRFPKKRVLGPKYGAWGIEKYGKKPVKMEAAVFTTERLSYLYEKILEEQKVANKLDAPAAFITFRHRRSQVTCSSILQHHDTSAWVTKPAPPTEGIIWKNLRLRQWERSVRSLLVLTAVIFLGLTYMIPITALQALLGSDSVLTFVGSFPLMSSLYAAVLPGLALQIFSALLPLILRILTTLEGLPSTLEVDLGVVKKYFAFQVIIVLLGTLITGSLLSQLKQFIKNPSSVLSIIGAAAPQSSLFFLTYITLQALIVAPIQWLRLPGLILFWVRQKLSYGDRAQRRVWELQDYTFGDDIATITFHFLLGIVYSPIMPIFSTMAFLYSVVLLLTWKYNLMYVYTQRVQGGARLWETIFWQFVTALLVMQSFVAAIIALKKHITAACLMIPQPIITLIIAIAAHNRFSKPQTLTSLQAAVDNDIFDAERDAEKKSEDTSHDWRESASSVEQAKEDHESGKDAYLNPVFKLDKKAHAGLMREAQFWLNAVKTGEVDEQELELLYPSSGTGGEPIDQAVSHDVEQGSAGNAQQQEADMHSAASGSGTQTPTSFYHDPGAVFGPGSVGDGTEMGRLSAVDALQEGSQSGRPMHTFGNSNGTDNGTVCYF